MMTFRINIPRAVLWLALTVIASGCRPAVPSPTPAPAPSASATSAPAALPSPTVHAPSLTPAATPQPFIGSGGALPEQARLRLGIGAIEAMALSPDGAQLALGTRTGIYVYRVDGFAPVWKKYTGDAVDAVTWSADGRRLLTGAHGSPSTLWDARTGHKIDTVGEIGVDAISPDSALIASATWTNTDPDTKQVQPAAVDILDGHTGDFLDKIAIENPDPYQTIPTALLWSPDRSLAVGTLGDIFVWDSARHLSRWHKDASSGGFVPEAFSPDGRWLAVATRGSGHLDIVDGRTGAQETTLADGSDELLGALWSPDGHWIALRTLSEVRLVDATTWATVKRMPISAGSISWSPDSVQLAIAASGDLTVIKVPMGAVEMHIALDGAAGGPGLPQAIWLRDSHRLLTATPKNLALWDVPGGKRLAGFSSVTVVDHVAWSANGPTLVLSGQDGAQLWDVTSAAQLAPASAGIDPAADVRRPYFTATQDGTSLEVRATSGDLALSAVGQSSGGCGDGPSGGGCLYDKGDLAITSASDSKLVYHQSFNTGITSLAWSSDNSRLAVGLGNGIHPEDSHGIDQNKIVIVNVLTGQVVADLAGHSGSVIDLAWSPDGRWLVSLSADGTVIVWNVS